MTIEMFHDQSPQKNVADPVADPDLTSQTCIQLSHQGRLK